MKIILFSVIVLTGLNIAGCDSCGSGIDLQSKPYHDTFSIHMQIDSFKFQVVPFLTGFNHSPTVSIVHDPALSDSIRFELDVEVSVAHNNIERSFLSPEWQSDSLTLVVGYHSYGIIPQGPQASAKLKAGVQEPQCTPIEDGDVVEFNVIKVFIPNNAEATYIGF